MPKTLAERQETKYIRELRKENTKLRREVSQLRRKTSKLEQNQPEDAEDIEFFEPLPDDPQDFHCPNCQQKQDVIVFKLRGVEYFKCHHCGKKGLVSPKFHS